MTDTRSAFERSPQRWVRLAGVAYLLIILLGLFGEVGVREALIARGDAEATARNIAASPLLWRLGIGGDLLMHLLDLPTILVFYLLLRPVNRELAILSTLFNLVQTAVLAANKMTLVLPLLLLAPGRALAALPPEQLHALAYLSIRAHDYGFAIGLLFFGVTCVIRGVLLARSGYFPRALGLLLVAAGVAYIANSVALLVVPWLSDLVFPVFMVMVFVGEAGLALWLVVKGVDEAAWRRAT